MRAFAAALLVAASGVHAELQPRDLDPNLPGHEAVYDTARSITWLADTGGPRSWNDSATFAANLSLGAPGWRMANDAELFGLYSEWKNAGIAQFGGAFLFDHTNSPDAGLGSILFTRAGEDTYWTTYEVGQYRAILVLDRGLFDGGEQLASACCAIGWAVHGGDVATQIQPSVSIVPESSTVSLLGAGLLLCGAKFTAGSLRCRPCRRRAPSRIGHPTPERMRRPPSCSSSGQ